MTSYDLELASLRKVYPGGTLAVDAFDLQVDKGEFISFVGPSGCGKTTTLRMIAGLESITSGQLLIKGSEYTRVPTESRPTATIFQNYALFPHMSVYENIEFGLTVRRVAPAERRQRVQAIIEKLQLGDVTTKRQSALSGGQKQRVALARGLVTEPDILLLDEPLGALDANLRKSIQEELKLLQRSLGITFVFVTHAQSEALSMGDRVVVMNSGMVEQISEPFELYTRPQSAFVARFIGRNKIIPGTLAERSGDLVSVDSGHGILKGTAAFEQVATGTSVLLVVPSEYVQIHSRGEPIEAPYVDSVSGTVTLFDPVGDVAHIAVELTDGTPVRLESYLDKVTGKAIAQGSEVDLRWSPEWATVVLDPSGQA